MKLKKLLCLLLVMCLLASVLPAGAHAAESSGSCGENVTWTLKDGTLTISGGDVGSKYHVAILGGEVILSGTPLLFNGSENTSGEYLGCDIACCTVYVEAELDEVIYTYYDSEVMNEHQNFAEFTGYSLSSDRTYFDRVN